MQAIKEHKALKNALNKQWLQQVCKVGFAFFLVKGLLWLIAIWLIF